MAFATVNVTNCYFSSPQYDDPAAVAKTDQTMGAFIFIILDVQMLITNSTFLYGIA